MAVPAVHVKSEVQDDGVLVTWEAAVPQPIDEYGVRQTWVIQDMLHADTAPTVVKDILQTFAVLYPPRCEWSSFVVYKVTTTVTAPPVTTRSRPSEPSVPVYVSCGPICKCQQCTPSVTFQRNGGSWFSRRL